MARRKKFDLEYGEGSFFFDEKRQLWIGRIEAGWTPDGKRRRIQVAARDKNTCWDRLTARRKALEIDGVATALQRSVTLQVWCERWLEATQQTLRPKSWSNNRSQVKRWIIPELGRRKLEELTPADVRRLVDAIRASGASTTTAASVQGCLQNALRAARVEGYAVPESVLAMRRPSKAVNDRTAIPLTDAIRLIEQAQCQPDAARWVAALLQGMRQGECLGLTWEAVNFKARTLDVSWQLQPLPYVSGRSGEFRIPDGYEVRQLYKSFHLVRPKSRPRMIPMVPWLDAALRQWREAAPGSPHGLVWPRRDGKPQTSRADSEAWKALQAAAGVSKGDGLYVLHEARHTTATLLLAAGVDEAVITAIMGHSEYATTQTYLHAPTELLSRALDRVAEQLQLASADDDR